jgi:hypothetical protein
VGEQRIRKSMGCVRLRQRVVYGDAVACLLCIYVPTPENHVLKGIGVQGKKRELKFARLIFSRYFCNINRK